MQTVLFSKDFFLRQPVIEDYAAFVAWATGAVDCYSLWLELPVSPEAFQAYIHDCTTDSVRGFLIYDKHSNAIQGMVHLNNVYNGNFQNAFLGYCFKTTETSESTMGIVIRLVTHYALTKLKLHRLEVSVQLQHTKLMRALRTSDYRSEGVSPRLLKVGGRWRDHERFAVTAEEWSGVASYV